MSFLGIGGDAPGLEKVQAQQIGLDPAQLQKQNDFVNMMQTQAQGGGPSVATQMLQNQQQAQAASTNAQIAGARGVNPGMAMRQGIQANATANQQYAGQGAAARMGEQINAQGMLGTQLNNMQEQSTGVKRANQQADLGAKGMNVDQAKQVAGNQAGLVGGLMNSIGSALPMLALAPGGMVPGTPPPTHIAPHPAAMFAPGGIAQTPSMNVGDPTSEIGKYLKGDTGAAGAEALNKGASSLGKGIMGMKKPGGDVAGYSMPEMGAQFAGTAPSLGVTPGAPQGPSMGVTGGPMTAPMSGVSAPMAPNIFGVSTPAMGFKSGGAVPAMVSPGERYLPPQAVKQVAKGKNPMKAGEKIPGKPKVKGDSYANDTVPKTLQSGGIVIPKHITEAPNAPERAAEFVRAIMAKQGLRR